MANNDSKPGDKPKGWFSRRYPTSEEHNAARSQYIIRHLKYSAPVLKKSDKSMEQVHAQLDRLDIRLGEGVGARKERLALLKQLEALGA